MLDLQLQLNILYVIICVYILYKIYYKSTENFALTDDIKAQINSVYKADVDAIRNLSAIASALQAGGLTVPGNLNVTGTIVTGQRIFAGTANHVGGIWVDGDGSNGKGSFIGCGGDGTVLIWRDGVNVAVFYNNNIVLNAPVTVTKDTTVAGVLTAGNVLVGAHEIQLQYNGKAHYGIINDGNFRIKNTSVNGAIGSAGTDLIVVDTAGNTTLNSNLKLYGTALTNFKGSGLEVNSNSANTSWRYYLPYSGSQVVCIQGGYQNPDGSSYNNVNFNPAYQYTPFFYATYQWGALNSVVNNLTNTTVSVDSNRGSSGKSPMWWFTVGLTTSTP